MATASEKGDGVARRKRRKKGYAIKGFLPVGGGEILTKKEILAEAEKLVIKPGMKLTWDNELNRMVWR